MLSPVAESRRHGYLEDRARCDRRMGAWEEVLVTRWSTSREWSFGSLKRELEDRRRQVAELTHRVNNVLMGISGCAEIALSALEDGHPAALYVSEIHTAALDGVEAATGPDEAAPSPGVAGSLQTILLVEDDLRVQMVIRYYLEQAGHRVLSVASADAALECCERYGGRIGLILTTLALPEPMTAPALVQAGRERRPDLPAIFMSAHPRDELPRLDLAPGDRVISKPFARRRLFEVIGEVLAGPPVAKERGQV
jgi:CheY-like chemotaxis protein